MTTHRKSVRGNTVVEMALVFVPLAFMLLSSFELGRGLWMYHTFTNSLKSGTRFLIVHGGDCIAATSKCEATVADVSSIIKTAGIGLDPAQLQLTLTDGDTTYACGTLTSCLTDHTQWPSANGNSAGSSVTVQGRYSFKSVLGSFWPGQARASVDYVASSTEVIEF